METTFKKSAKQQAKDKAVRNRELVLALLEWSELQYGEFVMQCAEEYLKMQCGPDVYGIDMLMHNKLFWAWWCNHWNRIDEEFLTKWADCECVVDVQNEYEFMHSASNLNFRPHRVIMDCSYMQMVQEVINKDRYANH